MQFDQLVLPVNAVGAGTVLDHGTDCCASAITSGNVCDTFHWLAVGAYPSAARRDGPSAPGTISGERGGVDGAPTSAFRTTRPSAQPSADTSEPMTSPPSGRDSHNASVAQAEAIARSPESGEGARPARIEVDAVMWFAQLMVAISARSLAAMESEVSLPQLRVLVILASQGSQSLNAVARSLDIHPSNATRACDKLVASGLLHRGEGATDRRLLELSLTSAGEQLVSRVMGYRRAQIEELLAQMPAQDRVTLTKSLATLATVSDTTLHGETLNKAVWQAGWPTVATPAERAG